MPFGSGLVAENDAEETKNLREGWETGRRKGGGVGDGETAECGLGQTENR